MVLVKVMATMYSFQARKNAKIAAADIPGSAMGIDMYNIVLDEDNPSIRAASSIATGIVSKYPLRSQVFIGAVCVA